MERILLPQYAAADVERWYNDVSPQELFAELRSLGVQCKATASGLVFRDPQRALTHRLRQAIKRRQGELLPLLPVQPERKAA